MRKFGFESNFMDIAHGLQTMCFSVLNQSERTRFDMRGWFAVPPGSSAAFAEVWDRFRQASGTMMPWHGATLRHQRLHTLLDQDGGIFGLGGVADTTVRQPREGLVQLVTSWPCVAMCRQMW